MCRCFKTNRWYVKDCSLHEQILCHFKQSSSIAAFKAGYRRKPTEHSRTRKHTAFQHSMIFFLLMFSKHTCTPLCCLYRSDSPSSSFTVSVLPPLLSPKSNFLLFSDFIFFKQHQNLQEKQIWYNIKQRIMTFLILKTHSERNESSFHVMLNVIIPSKLWWNKRNSIWIVHPSIIDYWEK